MTLTGTVWVPAGPSPMAQGGRQDNGLTTAIAVNPNNPDVVYQGTAGGGVWRSLNGGDTWTPIFDRQLSLGIGEPSAIAIDPTDSSTIYVGHELAGHPAGPARACTGRPTAARAAIRLGSGYPAGNVGNASQFFTRIINVIIVDPASAEHRLPGDPERRLPLDRRRPELDPGSRQPRATPARWCSTPRRRAGARILYAGITGRGRDPVHRRRANWTADPQGATPAVGSAVGAGSFGKVVVDIAPPTSPPNAAGVQVLYVPLSGTGGAPDPVGLFLSTDAGSDLDPADRDRACRRAPRAATASTSAVDPASPGDGEQRHDLRRCVGQARSTNSGTTFTGLSGLHADTHAWAFVRQPSPTPSTVYCGNDGGIFRSTDDGATWVALQRRRPADRPVLQPRCRAGQRRQRCSWARCRTTVSRRPPARPARAGTARRAVTAGTSRSTVARHRGPTARAGSGARRRAPGSGGPTTTAPAGPRRSPRGARRPTRAATSRRSPATPAPPGIVYVERQPEPLAEPGRRRHVAQHRRRPRQPLGRPHQRQQRRRDPRAAGLREPPTRSPRRSARPPGSRSPTSPATCRAGRVLRAAFDPIDPTVIYAVLGGFDGAGPAQRGHVFRTTVGGTAWETSPPPSTCPSAVWRSTARTPRRPSTSAPTSVCCARSTTAASWTVLDDLHLPRAPVTDLVLSQGGVLRAATYGRGVFEFRRPKGPAIAVNLEDGLDFGTVCEGRNYRTLQVFNVGNTDLVITSVAAPHGLHRVLRAARTRHARGARPGRGDRLQGRVHAQHPGDDRDRRPSGS